MSERRKYIRISDSLIISYRALNAFLRSGSRTKDISQTGICLPIPQRLEPGALLELEIHLREFEKTIVVTGKVVWIKERKNAQFPFEAGIEFIKIDPSDRDKIFSYINEKLKNNTSTEVHWLE